MPITREMIQAEYDKSETQASLEKSVETALNSSKDFQEKHALNPQDLDSLSNTLLSRWTSTLYGKLVIDGKIVNSEEEITETQAKKQIEDIIKAKDVDANSNFNVLISKKVQDVVAQASKAKQLQAEADRAPLDNLMTKAIEDSLESIINARVANKIKAKETQWESKDNTHVRFMLRDAIRNNVPQQQVVKQITDFLDKQTAILDAIPNLGQAALEKAQANALVQPQGAQEQPTIAVSESETIQKIIDFMAQPFALLVKQQAEILLQQKKTEWDKDSTIAVIKLLMPQVKKQFPQSNNNILLAFKGKITHQNMIALATPLLKKNANLAQNESSVGPEPKANSAEVLQPPSVQLSEPEAPSLQSQQPAAPEAENPKENIENDAVLAQRLQREEQSARDEAQRRKEEEEAASLAFIHQRLSQEEAQAAAPPAIEAPSIPLTPAPVLPADVQEGYDEDPDFEMALALSLSEEQQREAQEREAQKKPLTFAPSPANPRAPTSALPSTAPAAAAPQAAVPPPSIVNVDNPQTAKAKTSVQSTYSSLESYITSKKDEAKAGKLHKGSFYGKSNQVEKLTVAEQALSTLKSTALTDEAKLTAMHRLIKANKKHTGIAVFHNHGGELAHILESAKSDLTSRLSNQPYKAVFAELEAYVQEAEQNYTSLHSGLSVGSFMIKSNQIEKFKIAQNTLALRERLKDSNSRVSPAINRDLDYLIRTKETIEGSIEKNTALTAGSNPLHSEGQLHSILENLKNEIETEINNLKTAPLSKHS